SRARLERGGAHRVSRRGREDPGPLPGRFLRGRSDRGKPPDDVDEPARRDERAHVPPGPSRRRAPRRQHVRAPTGARARAPLRSGAAGSAGARGGRADRLPQPVKVEVFPTRAALAGKAAEALARVLRRNRYPVLLLPAGKTAVPVYRELRRLHAAGRAPMARATTFNLDELRLPAADPRSFRSFMDRHLFSDV